MARACPECDSSRIQRRSSSTPWPDWLCTNCHHEFDEPVERRPKHSSPEGSMARILEDADPDIIKDRRRA